MDTESIRKWYYDRQVRVVARSMRMQEADVMRMGLPSKTLLRQINSKHRLLLTQAKWRITANKYANQLKDFFFGLFLFLVKLLSGLVIGLVRLIVRRWHRLWNKTGQLRLL